MLHVGPVPFIVHAGLDHVIDVTPAIRIEVVERWPYACLLYTSDAADE